MDLRIANLIVDIVGCTAVAWLVSGFVPARFRWFKDFLSHVLLGELVLVAIVLIVLFVQPKAPSRVIQNIAPISTSLTVP